MAEKRYYWLRLKEDFFLSKRIKKLRRLAGGDTYTIIYLKMQLLSIKTDGVLKYTGLEKTFAEELALDIDEDVENVAITLNYLMNCGLCETSDSISFLLPYAVENTGSEGSSAQRMREHRKEQASHCATLCEHRYGEIEIDKDIDIKKETNKERKSAFTKPSVKEVDAFINERGYHFDAESFVAFYESNGWKVGKNPMKSWKACCVTWENRRKNTDVKVKKNNFHNFSERANSMSNKVSESFNKLMEGIE